MSVLTLVSAVARRIGGPRGRARAAMFAAMQGDDASQRTIEELRDEVDQLRAQLSDVQARLAQVDELHERLDFAERLLTKANPRGIRGE